MQESVAVHVTVKCPGCGQLLRRSADMWGLFYVCDDCGYATDDDGIDRLLAMEFGKLHAEQASLFPDTKEGGSHGLQ